MQGFITSIRQKNTSLETKLDFEVYKIYIFFTVKRKRYLHKKKMTWELCIAC